MAKWFPSQKNLYRVEWCIGGVGITLEPCCKKTASSGNGTDAGCTSKAENPFHGAIEEED